MQALQPKIVGISRSGVHYNVTNERRWYRQRRGRAILWSIRPSPLLPFGAEGGADPKFVAERTKSRKQALGPSQRLYTVLTAYQTRSKRGVHSFVFFPSGKAVIKDKLQLIKKQQTALQYPGILFWSVCSLGTRRIPPQKNSCEEKKTRVFFYASWGV
jgi:hypothetical protein